MITNIHRYSPIVMTTAAQKIHDELEPLMSNQTAVVDLTIFVSCYNEEVYIIDTLNTIVGALDKLTISYEIIIIDDVSSDRSVELIEQYIAEHPQQLIILRKNPTNKGLAQNYLDAAFLGKGKYYRLICGDNAEPRESLVKIFSHLGKADMIVPYYADLSGKSLYRRLVSNTYTYLINSITGFKLHYYNGLAVHLRYNVMRWHPNTRGFGFQADILCMLLDEGFTCQEVPVSAVHRKGQDSKALTFKNFLSVTHTIVDVVIRRLSNWVYQKKNK